MNLEAVKQIPISSYLKSVGFEPSRQSGNRLFYHSPFNAQDKTPSFVVRPKQNDFKCYSSERYGDIIQFVMQFKNVDFIEAVKQLHEFEPNQNLFFFVCKINTEEISEDEPIKILKVKQLENKALINYVASRNVNIEIAKRYLTEIYYELYDKRFFALGFKNDLEGYELRNKFWKGGTSPKTITTVIGTKSDALLLFEGFFDFLSYLTITKQHTPEYNSIISNSITSNLNRIYECLPSYSKIFCVLDNDRKGREKQAELERYFRNIHFIDCSHRYDGFKDLNEYLQSSRNAQE